MSPVLIMPRCHRAMLVAAAVAVGCGDELPLQERIASTRPLAMRIEVLEPTKPPEDASRAEALPLETLRVVPFIVDVDGPLTTDRITQQMEPVWLACNMRPGAGLFGCLSAQFPTSLEAIEDCPAVDPTMFDPSAGLSSPPNPCRMVAGTPDRPQVQVPPDLGFLLGGDLEITMIGHRPGDGNTEACAASLLGEADSIPEACIVSVMRAPIGPDAELTALARMLGLDEGFELGAIPDPIPDPDENPQIETFNVAVVAPDGTITEAVEVARGDVLTVAAGSVLQIVTVAPESNLQEYVVQRDDLGFETRTELYTGRWYRTWGELLSAGSDDPTSNNTWTMLPGAQDPSDLPPDGRATLYYVLRDDRQGVDWWWFSVDVTPE